MRTQIERKEVAVKPQEEKVYLFKFNNFTTINANEKYGIYSAYAEIKDGQLNISVRLVGSRKPIDPVPPLDYNEFIAEQMKIQAEFSDGTGDLMGECLEYDDVAQLIKYRVIDHINQYVY